MSTRFDNRATMEVSDKERHLI
ncbi:hypothetical protein LCGC14_1092630, partial [marine sediment metagenome]